MDDPSIKADSTASPDAIPALPTPPVPTTGPNKTVAANRAQLAVRRKKAMDLRLAGARYDEIAKALGISHSVAFRDVSLGIKAVQGHGKESATKWRGIHLLRIEAVLMALWPKRSDPKVADSIWRGLEREAKLLGLDEPEKVEVAHRFATTEEAIAELEAGARAMERAKRFGIVVDAEAKRVGSGSETE
jgi:hypothetical protein